MILVLLAISLPTFCGLKREGHTEMLSLNRNGVETKLTSTDARSEGSVRWFEVSPDGQAVAVLHGEGHPVRVVSIKNPSSVKSIAPPAEYGHLSLEWVGQKLRILCVRAENKPIRDDKTVTDFLVTEDSETGLKIIARSENVTELPFPNRKYTRDVLPKDREDVLKLRLDVDTPYHHFSVLPIAETRTTFILGSDGMLAYKWGSSAATMAFTIVGSHITSPRYANNGSLSITLMDNPNPFFRRWGPARAMTDAVADSQIERYRTVLFDKKGVPSMEVADYVGAVWMP